MARKKYQTRLPADTADEVDEFIDEREITQAEGIRRLVESGLEAQDEPDEYEGGRIERAGYPRGVIPAILVLVLVSTILLVVDLIVSLGVI